MKLTIQKEELLKILRFSEKIVENKNPNNPIFSCINLIFSKNNAKCVCTNGIISGCYEIDFDKVEIEEPGKILIKNKILLDLASKLKEDEIHLNKVENSVLIVKTKTFSSQINILDDSEFPNLNFSYDNLPCLTLNEQDINEIFKKNSGCTFNDVNQTKTISGIYFDKTIDSNYLTTLSTDSFRLAYLKSINTNDFNDSFILNNTTLITISQIFKGINQDIKFYVDKINQKIYIQCGKIIIVDRSIIGDYPVDIFVKAFNINKITTIKLDKQELINALELGKVTVNLENNPIITFNVENNKLELSSSSFEIGSTKTVVPTSEIVGSNIKIGFNITFLLTLLRNIDSKTVNLIIESSNKPMIIVGDNENFKELILPVRLDN